MNKNRAPLAYATPSGDPVLSQTFSLTAPEKEAVEVRDQIVMEGVASPSKAGLLVTYALKPGETDPNFVEWLTCGLITVAHGVAHIEKDTLLWLQHVKETGTVW